MTVDVMADGTRRPGGTAFYSGLQASRLGMRTLILTRGLAEEIEQMLDPYRAEFDLEIQPAEHTTTLLTSGTGAARSQRVLAWAGPIEGEPALETSVLHLAPVAAETPRRWAGEAGFVGLTPQGLARRWADGDGEMSLTVVDPDALPERCDAIVISEVEQAVCAEVLSRARAAGGIVAVTAGHRPTTLLMPDGETRRAAAPATELDGEDVGAGDVYAAAFFIALHEGRPPSDAATFAGAAAALRIGARGTRGISDRTAIESLVRARSELPR
ncbi:MAG TPA: PfkB family carbohydrate kinase [Solirubrobacteraceae bacterium]|nr:PfkB family carbohydrate kinase [Solirubrobacteraceae bacterium]